MHCSGCSEIYATCSNSIRVWNAKSQKEVLRITVPNMSCNCLVIIKDGRSIVSGKSFCTPCIFSKMWKIFFYRGLCHRKKWHCSSFALLWYLQNVIDFPLVFNFLYPGVALVEIVSCKSSELCRIMGPTKCFSVRHEQK